MGTRYSWSWALALLAAAILPVLGCRASNPATHLIKDGYEGPIVIIFEDPAGIVPSRTDTGIIYAIRADGVLRLNWPAPRSGTYDNEYFYLREDGSRVEIPYYGDGNSLQVFADTVGAAGTRGGSHVPYAAYVVRVPNERDDCFQLRAAAAAAATGVPTAM